MLRSWYGFQVIAATILLASCMLGTPENVVPEARNETVLSKYGVSCGKPAEYTQDCCLTVATRPITLDEVPFKIAGSEDGRHVRLTANYPISFMLRTGNPSKYDTYKPMGISYLELFKSGEATNIAYRATKRELAKQGIQVVSATPAGDEFGTLRQYLLEMDGDGYSVLKALSQNPEKNYCW